MEAIIKLNRGSNKPFTGFWPSAPGSSVGANLTGFAIDAIFVHPNLVGNIALNITDAANGLFAGKIIWDDDMPIGAIMSFVIRISASGEPETLPEITVLVQ